MDRGQKHGQGTLRLPDGAYYEGAFVDDNFHGHSRFVSANGDMYDGQWVGGKKHGQGKSSDLRGYVYDGAWEGGKKSGEGTLDSPNGVYKGQFENNIFTSRGIWLAKVDGKNDTTGFSWETGCSYEGTWQNTAPKGPFTVKKPNGATMTVQYA